MKLTVGLREKINRIVTTETFKNRKEMLHKQFDIIMDELYDSSYNSEDRNVMMKYPHLFNKDRTFYIYNNVGKMIKTHSFENARPYPRNKNSLQFMDSNDKLYMKYLDYSIEEKKMQDDIHDFKSKVNGVLYSVNTTNQLFTVWPELCDQFPGLVQHINASKPNSQLPAVINVIAINKIIEDNKHGV